MDGICLPSGSHEAVLSYLRIKKENFYTVENTVDGKFFVTARGWEDLSEILKSYEEFQIPVTESLVSQYLRKKRQPEFCRLLPAVPEVRHRLWDLRDAGRKAFR